MMDRNFETNKKGDKQEDKINKHASIQKMDKKGRNKQLRKI
jgi:hypothetical protein